METGYLKQAKLAEDVKSDLRERFFETTSDVRFFKKCQGHKVYLSKDKVKVSTYKLVSGKHVMVTKDVPNYLVVAKRNLPSEHGIKRNKMPLNYMDKNRELVKEISNKVSQFKLAQQAQDEDY